MEHHYVIDKINKYLEMDEHLTPLYHYTSVYGIEGILKKREFWVSHSDFLNDKTERKYTFNLFINILDNKLGGFSRKKELIDLILSNINSIDFPIYVLSFCQNKDSNLMWSNYSNNDGYNLEFDLSTFRSGFKILDANDEDSVATYKSKVIYDKDIHKKAITELADDYIEIFEDSSINGAELTIKLYNLQLAFQILSAFFKDECFQQEEEHRFILVPAFADDLAYHCRVANGAFIPYTRIGFDSNLIKGVTIGPKNKMDISEEGLKSFLTLNGFDSENIEIKRSNIPYRY
ncbi:DUF2971 domain-containing protein [Bacillus safensis]|uniref:DUF2971 domain-containing protein n=1 Tax=Bacillus safensis TaxID=561879 RepID=UPI0020757D20|nr:DUF2971 domain-containing protein [Bacillus safensis]USD81672.1 DUF2971 domain-containing protein [Bacillus safensis]